MNFETEVLDLDYMEQDAEEHLTQQEALLLGLEFDTDAIDATTDAAGWIRM